MLVHAAIMQVKHLLPSILYSKTGDRTTTKTRYKNKSFDGVLCILLIVLLVFPISKESTCRQATTDEDIQQVTCVSETIVRRKSYKILYY